MANDSASLFFSLILTFAALSAGSKPGSAHTNVMITFTGSTAIGRAILAAAVTDSEETVLE